MKLPTLLQAFAILLILTFTSCSSDSIEENIDTTIPSFVPQAKTIELEALELINEHRINIGLNPLEDLSVIKAVAFDHTDFMIETNEVTHANFFERKSKLEANAGALKVGENLAFAYTNAEALVNAWLSSEGHRKNIESVDYTHFDISAEPDEDGRFYYTNIFIKK